MSDFFAYIDPENVVSQGATCSSTPMMWCPTPKTSKKSPRSCTAMFNDLWTFPISSEGASQGVTNALGATILAGQSLAMPVGAGNGAAMAISLPSISWPSMPAWPENWTVQKFKDGCSPPSFSFEFKMPEKVTWEDIKNYFENMPTNVVAQWHSKGILTITFLQGIHSVARVMHGDVFGGTYGCMLSLLGYRSRMPGPARVWLKTYVLITFINGIVGSLELAQQILLHTLPHMSWALPMHVNFLALLATVNPFTSFAGAYFGWQFIKCLKKLAMEDYQQRVAMYGQGGAPGAQMQLPGMMPGMQLPQGMPQMNAKQMAEVYAQAQQLAAAVAAQQQQQQGLMQPTKLETIKEEEEVATAPPSVDLSEKEPEAEDGEPVICDEIDCDGSEAGDETPASHDGPIITDVN